jgi:hypothetical protein
MKWIAKLSLLRRLALAIILLALPATFGATPAAACPAAIQQTATLLPNLPATAQQDEIVAKVEIIELLPYQPGWTGSQPTTRVKVRVVEAIKGVHPGQTMLVQTRGTSCDQVLSRDDLGRQAYVAGGMRASETGETVLKGAWRIFGEQRVAD